MRRPDCISLDLPADIAYLHVPGACLAAISETVEDLAWPEGVLYGLQLAVYEVCTNIVSHAYGISGLRAEDTDRSRIRIDFTITAQPSILIIDFYDTGCPFDLSLISGPDLAEPQTSGYGLYLIRQLVDEVLYEAEPDRNHWRLTKHL